MTNYVRPCVQIQLMLRPAGSRQQSETVASFQWAPRWEQALLPEAEAAVAAAEAEGIAAAALGDLMGAAPAPRPSQAVRLESVCPPSVPRTAASPAETRHAPRTLYLGLPVSCWDGVSPCHLA